MDAAASSIERDGIGCKTVIGQRFKQSGMIWSLKGAKALLPLRTLHKSNRLD